MKSILKSYRHRLLNLSSSNKALLLLRLSSDLHLDVQELDFLNNMPAFSLIEKALSEAQKMVLGPYADSRYTPATPLSRSLRYIKRKAEMIFEERGSRELYLGWPFVHGRFADGTAVRCPLLFFPVQLQVNAARQWELLRDPTQAAQFNQSFLLAYAHYMNSPLAEPLLELDLHTLSQHPLEFRTQLYALLKEHGLAVHAGRELFADQLKGFREYKKADYEASCKPGQLFLEQEAVLGIFPQTASYVLADYDTLLAQDDLQQMEDLFAAKEIPSGAPMGQAQHTFTAFALDAAQEAALQQVKQGKSLVVQGPPGTGKSQLICNLVTDFTARGKKVLVVSQKRAALDVVHRRLAQQGLASFAALVHDINADRKSVYVQLQQQIEQLDAYKKQNLALNSIYTDRLFLEASRGINRCMHKLESFREALFATGLCGWSAKELYLRSSLQAPHVPLPVSFRQFTAASLPDFLPRLRYYLQLALPLHKAAVVWQERRSMKDYGWPQRQALEQVIRELPAQYQQAAQEMSELSGRRFTLDALPGFVEALELISQVQRLLEKEGLQELASQLLRQPSPVRQLQAQVQQLRKLYLVCPAPDAAIPADQVAAVQAAIEAHAQQQGSLFGRIRWLFSKEKKVLGQALAKYRLAPDEAGVGELQRRLELRRQAEGLMQAINEKIELGLRLTDNPTPVLEKLKLAKAALALQQLLKKLKRRQVLHQKHVLASDWPMHLQALVQCIHSLQAQYDSWLQWLTENQIRQLATQPGYQQQLLEALSDHFERLVAHDACYDAFSKTEIEIVDELLAQDVGSAEEGERLLRNSLYLAWLHALEEQHPELRMPANGELDALETELQEWLEQKQVLSQEIVLARLREQTYRYIEYNRLGNAVTYRRLLAQVSKKRSLFPIRKLFSLFADEILQLVPCWLASPETVSAVLPLERCFDLVIFDEASQCFAETGLPAMLRGRQVVVAGDARQLRPSDLYRTRWNGSGADEAEELTAESLLELCSLYLPQAMLTQHYRSRYPELIDFSNRHFYRRRLELIPAFADVNARQPAISFVKVQGLWQDNRNLAEAERVVELVLQLLQAGQEDVGVITFNYNQQMLVQDLLEEQGQQKGLAIPGTVLVKNIENIQGDEKEVIILSVGYAPDEKGKLAMQFGALNQVGGENRLNVAITRARQRVVVVSSIRAEQLQVAHTLHPGPKLLQEYLLYAQQVSRRYFVFTPTPASMPAQVPLLKQHLKQQLPQLREELPFADLTSVQAGNYQGVVLTDDDLYCDYLSVRQAHADVPQLLQARKWPYKRVYSRQYWQDKEEVLAKLQERG